MSYGMQLFKREILITDLFSSTFDWRNNDERMKNVKRTLGRDILHPIDKVFIISQMERPRIPNSY